MKLVIWVVKKLLTKKLRVRDRMELTNCIMERLSALPLHDIIYVNNVGSVIVNGKEMDTEQISTLREGAKMALNNKTFRFIREQVLYQSFLLAANRSQSDADLIFGKAAIWWGQQEDEKLKLLAGLGENVL